MAAGRDEAKKLKRIDGESRLQLGTPLQEQAVIVIDRNWKLLLRDMKELEDER